MLQLHSKIVGGTRNKLNNTLHSSLGIDTKVTTILYKSERADARLSLKPISSTSSEPELLEEAHEAGLSPSAGLDGLRGVGAVGADGRGG